MITAIRAYWDRHAAEYDALPGHGISSAADVTAWKAILGSTIRPNARVLDFGCGTGALSLVLAGMGHEVIGIDVSPEMIARASSKSTSGRVEFRAGDESVLDGSFDCVVSRHVFWSLPDPEATLGTLRTVLHPAGQIMIIDGNWYSGVQCKEQIEDDYPTEVKRKLPLLDQERPTADEALLRQSGFTDIRTIPNLLSHLETMGIAKADLASFDKKTSQFLVSAVLSAG